MLKHLHISHYALIDSLDIDMTEGYTVITGETGAGKSILLGALNLLLGARADAHAVKQGEQKCVVEAVFDIQGQDLHHFFEDNDLEWDTAECTLRRELTAAGKSRAFVNDSPVLLPVLKNLGALLVDIHSQHQNQLLSSEEYLLHTLDLVAANDKERQAYTTAFAECRQAQDTLEQQRRQAQRDSEEQDLLRFQLQQLNELSIQEGEQETLEEEQSILSHAGDIKEGIFQATAALSTQESDICQQLRQCQQALEGVSDHLPCANSLAERLESARIELDDILEELNRQQERVEFNPQRLAYVDDRLSQLYKLQKRHDVNTDIELIEVQQQLQSRLDAIDNADDDIRRLEKAAEQAHQALTAAATALTATRHTAAKTIAQSLTCSIAELGMPNGQVQIQLSPRPTPMENGADALEFLFSANKNVAVQNIRDIASGGETARLMLALKTFTARYRQLPTIIFDEIDTGVSGTMAEKMGQKMQELANHCQVICITHLPQIAALGTSHFRVYKEEDDHGTHSHITEISGDDRLREIANMLSGAEITEAAINNAKALLNY